MATIKDVAREAGVSISTVSCYLNKTKPVSKELGKKIQDAIDRLKYSHNILARNLRTKQNMDIGVILPNLEDSYYAQVFRGIKSYFRGTEYSVIVEFSENIPEFEQNIAENFLKKQVCGLFLVSCQPNKWKFYYDNFISKQIPLVLIDRKIHNLDANFVSFDNYNLMRRLTARLLKKGHRELYLVSGSKEYTCEADCIKGFTDACKGYGVSVKKDMFIKTDMSKEDAFRKTIKLLKSKKPEAVVTTTESLAMGAIEGLTILNSGTKEIPVATFSEEHWNYNTRFGISEYSVRTAVHLGQTAAKLMKKQMDEPVTSETEKIILPDCRMVGTEDVAVGQKKSICDGSKKLRVLLLETAQVNALLGLVQNFEIKTGIEVETTIVQQPYLYDTIKKNYYEETEPYDVFMYGMTWFPSLAAERILADITEEARKLKDIFFPNMFEYFSFYDGRNYGIPFQYSPQFLYYRKDLFEDPALKREYEKISSISLRPPTTLKEFNTVADFFTNKTDAVPYGIAVPGAYDSCVAQEIYWRLLATGGKFFYTDGVCLDSEQTLKAYINFIRSVKCAKPTFRQDTEEDVANAFLRGETAMVVSYPNYFMDVNDLRRSDEIGAIGYQIVPGHVPLLDGWGLGINSKSNQREKAIEFLRWVSDEQVASYMAILGGQSAVTSVYTNDALLETYPWLQMYYASGKYAQAFIPPTLSNRKVLSLHEIEESIGQWIYKVLDEGMEVHDAIVNTHRDLEVISEKYRNMQ